jgi:hypothetical protein
MSQNDGEPACQGKTYNALKDKKHLTRINKEGRVGKEGLFLSPTTEHQSYDGKSFRDQAIFIGY